MSTGPDSPEPDIRTSHLIGRCERVVRDALESRSGATDLTLPETGVLGVLADRPGLSNASLARAFLVSPQAMHKVVRSLESMGLVQRTSSPGGGRALLTTVTEDGLRALTATNALLDRVEADFLEPLGQDERNELRRLLTKLARLDRPSASAETG